MRELRLGRLRRRRRAAGVHLLKPPRLRWPSRLEVLVPLLVIVVEFGGVFVGFGPDRLAGMLLGLVVLYWIYHRPLGALKFLIFWNPTSVLLLSWLFGLGIPAGILKPARILDNLLPAAIFLAGYAARRARGEKGFDWLDRVAIGYLVVVGIWFVLTPLLAAPFAVPVVARFTGFRDIASFVVLFLGVRWLHFGAGQRASLRRWIYALGGVLGVVGLYQWFRPHSFESFIVNQVAYPRYLAAVPGLSGSAISDALQWFHSSPFRVSSFTAAPFTFADIMVVVAAVALARMVHRISVSDIVVVALAAVGVVLSGTRIDMVALAAIGLWAALGVRGYTEAARVRFLVILFAALVAFVPGVLSSRLTGSANTVSNAGHANELTTGWAAVGTHPLGTGLGNTGGILRLRSSSRDVTSGSTLSGIGMQAGWLALLLFLVLLVAVALAARRSNVERPDDLFGGAALLVLIGGFVTGLTHNAWTGGGTGLVPWMVLGVACQGMARATSPPDEEPGGPGPPGVELPAWQQRLSRWGVA